MKQAVLIALVCAFFLSAYGQTPDSLNQEVSPMGGLNRLVLHYYDIDFSKEQRKKLNSIDLELIYLIDEIGNPTLEVINGIDDKPILDSLRKKTAEIPRFNPMISNGTTVSSMYSIRFQYPSYSPLRNTNRFGNSNFYSEAKLDDFEYIEESGQRFDMTIGGMIYQFIGSPSEHLSLGGGMKIDCVYAGKNRLIYGMNMCFYGNKLKKDYPLNTTRDQLDGPPTLLVGLVFGKWFDRFNIQAEIDLATQNVTKNEGANDPEAVQLDGWSPGLVINYPIKFGKSLPLYYYGKPCLMENSLNLHAGLRFVKLSIDEATGFMAELGVSYRMVAKGISEYQLKDGTF